MMKTSMRNILSVLFALLLAVSLCALPVLAAEAETALEAETAVHPEAEGEIVHPEAEAEAETAEETEETETYGPRIKAAKKKCK